MSRPGWSSWGLVVFCLIQLWGLALSSTTTSSNHTPPVRGSGISYAESCQAALRSWSTASSSYGEEHGHSSTSIYSSFFNMSSQIAPGTTKVTSVITLCDGHPRVVGQVDYEKGDSTLITSRWTNTNPTFVYASYPTPAPCSIAPDDCELLYSSWTSHWDKATKANPDHAGLPDPPCTTRTQNHTFSTNSNGGECDNCQVAGSRIRLLYWPVITQQGVGNLCNKSEVTLTATPTGDGPNTFVTDGITITSPSVAVSIGQVSRVDKCGKTVAQTIIPVLPEDVSSVEGARALFTHRPFNFADLNYKCLGDPDKIFAKTKDRTDCYQEVPASAYFFGFANAAGADWYAPDAFKNSTIWPSYQPQVLPPNTLTQAIRSIWGPDCNIHPDGVWDPPIALGEVESVPLPKDGPGAPTEYYTPESTPAAPGYPTYPHGPSNTKAEDATALPAQDSDVADPTPTHPSPNPGTVHEVHTTIVTAPANAGKEYTHVVSDGKDMLVDEHTTMVVDAGGAGDADGVKTVGMGDYITQALNNGGTEVEGKSTTWTVDSAGSKTSAGGEDSQPTNDGSQDSEDGSQQDGDGSGGNAEPSIQGSSSASRSYVSTALVTCIHLSLLAVVVAICL